MGCYPRRIRSARRARREGRGSETGVRPAGISIACLTLNLPVHDLFLTCSGACPGEVRGLSSAGWESGKRPRPGARGGNESKTAGGSARPDCSTPAAPVHDLLRPCSASVPPGGSLRRLWKPGKEAGMRRPGRSPAPTPCPPPPTTGGGGTRKRSYPAFGLVVWFP